MMMLRPLHLNDTNELYQLIADNREHLRHLAWAQKATQSVVETYVESAIQNEYICAITWDEPIIGLISLRHFEDHSILCCWVAQQWCGRHVASQAIAQMCAANEQPVLAKTLCEQQAARKSLLNNGFVHIGGDETWDTWLWIPPSLPAPEDMDDVMGLAA